MAEHDERELEEAFRASLQGHADKVDVSAPIAQRALAASRRRRQSASVMTVAAVTVAVVGVAGFLATRGGSQGGDDARVVDRSSEPGEVVTEWRTEYWHGLQVDVPAGWGWGTAPTEMSVEPGKAMLCGGPGAMVRADGKRLVNPEGDVPWVGRPIQLSDLCIGGLLENPRVPYVWLGADIEPGVQELGNGYTQETVSVAGTSLTVASADAGLRRQILESARGATACEGQLPAAPEVTSMLIEGIGTVRTATVCGYARGAGGFDLVYGTTLEEKDASAAHDGVYAGQRQSSPDFCQRNDEYVLITFTGDDRYGSGQVSQDVVIDPACQEVQGAPGSVAPLSDEAMLPWSRNGLQVVLRSFIGMLG